MASIQDDKTARKASRPIFIAGGGTGGHIYPGLAIARAVQRKQANFDVHFIGARGGLEERIIPQAGFPLHLLHVGKLHPSAGLITRIFTLFKLPWNIIQAIILLIKWRPQVVLGVGGYASGPLLLVASLLRFRTMLWEPNAFPGMTNRWLAPWVDVSMVVFADAEKFLKGRRVVRVGLPVRSEIQPVESGLSSSSRFQRPLRVLVFGGSQGARPINNVILESLKLKDSDWKIGMELRHQTGRLDFMRAKEVYDQLSAEEAERFQVLEYIDDMAAQYKWADLVICRAGASTVAEICAAHKAAVFIPLPTAADDHQKKNAESLAKHQAAQMLLQKDLTPESFQRLLKSFRDDRSQIEEMEKKVSVFAMPHAVDDIVNELLKS